MKGGNKNMSPLGLLTSGERAEVIEIKTVQSNCCGTGKNQLCRVEDMGIRTGKEIEVLNNEGRGAMLIKIDESRIAIARGMAMRIMVKKTEQ
jgi:ferrous iron transport protein A